MNFNCIRLFLLVANRISWVLLIFIFNLFALFYISTLMVDFFNGVPIFVHYYQSCVILIRNAILVNVLSKVIKIYISNKIGSRKEPRGAPQLTLQDSTWRRLRLLLVFNVFSCRLLTLPYLGLGFQYLICSFFVMLLVSVWAIAFSRRNRIEICYFKAFVRNIFILLTSELCWDRLHHIKAAPCW